MKKRIIALVLCMAVVLGALSGCAATAKEETYSVTVASEAGKALAEANVEIVIQNIYLGDGYFHVCQLKSECLSGGSGVPRDKWKIHFTTPSLCINLPIQAGPRATLHHRHYIPASSCSPPWNIPTQHPTRSSH